MNKVFQTLSRRKFINNFVNFSFSDVKRMKTVDKTIVESLERLALVDFSTEPGIARLEKSIQFADKLKEIDTSSIEPLISTVYEINENVRKDEVTEASNREELMNISPVTEEFYYVAPLGTFSKKSYESS